MPKRLIEYDRESEMVMLSPIDAKWVEEEFLPKIRPRGHDRKVGSAMWGLRRGC